MDKDYGKLSADQLRQLVELLPSLEALRAEFRSDVKVKRNARKAVHEVEICWAPLYELSFVEHLAVSAVAVGLNKAIVAAAGTSDPPAYMMNAARGGRLNDIKPADGVKLGHVVGFVIS
jgi:hypothetical protein